MNKFALSTATCSLLVIVICAPKGSFPFMKTTPVVNLGSQGLNLLLFQLQLSVFMLNFLLIVSTVQTRLWGIDG
jgi:hypothetical protein